MTFNPDLLFDHGLAVGDVKYKVSKGDWDRADLNQVITFAEALPGTLIVMMLVPDPVSVGLVASLARPGGNVTGLTTSRQNCIPSGWRS